VVPLPILAVRFLCELEIVASETFRRDFVQQVHFLPGKCGRAKIVGKPDLIALILEVT